MERVSFETAKLAKEKGCKLLCTAYYEGDEPEGGYSENLYSPMDYNSPFFDPYPRVSAPYQEELQSWLRKEHGRYITILPCRIPSNEVKFFIFKGKLKHAWKDLFDTYEEALEFALKEVTNSL